MLKLLKMRWLFNKRTGLTILCMLVLIVIAAAINVLGIQAAGNIQNWTAWLKAHASIFLIWRIVLYIAVAYGWCWMRCRVIQREIERVTDKQSDIQNTEQNAKHEKEVKTRFIRIEVSAICSLLVLELSNCFA